MFNPYVDRMDYVAAISNGLGYCEAVEKLLSVEAPPRAQYIRVILTELNRIASHQLWLGTHALDIGAITPAFVPASRPGGDPQDFQRNTAALGSQRTLFVLAVCNTKPTKDSSRT